VKLASAALVVTFALFGEPAAERTPYDYDAKEAAGYLDAMHKRIHPMFFGRELALMDKQPASAPWNDRDAYAVLFMTVDAGGKLLDVNIVKGTGVPELNQAIRRSIQDAAPFAKPPPRLLSRDGRARIRWQFHRDPVKECAPTHAWPLIVEPG
jgi:TonB family protein